MADYQTQSYRLANGGLVARYSSDDLPPGTFRNLRNLESRAENSLASRYGWQGLTQDGVSNNPLPAPVTSLSKMRGLGGAFYRYAGAGTSLYRSNYPGPTSYSAVASGLSGNRLSMYGYRPATNANPWQFIADGNKLLKDPGTGTAQNWGIAPPFQPPMVQIGDPAKTVIEAFDEPTTGSFLFSNFTSPQMAVRAQGSFFGDPTDLGIVTFTEAAPLPNNIGRASNVTTLGFTTPHGWVSGMRISVNFFDPSFNMTSVVITVTSPTTLTYPNTGPNFSSTGTNVVTVSALPSIIPYMLVNIDTGANAETVTVLTVIPGVGFTANQTKTHSGITPYSAAYLSGSIAASTLATVTKPGVFDFTGTGVNLTTSLPVATWSIASNVVTLDFGVLATPPSWLPGYILAAQFGNFTASGPITGVSIVGGHFQIQFTFNASNQGGSGGNAQVVSGLGTIAQDDDYFSLFLQASDPFAVLEIRVAFDVGDGSFTKDYFYKSVMPATWQPAVSGTIPSGNVLTKRVFDRAGARADLRRLGVTADDLLPDDLQDLRWLRPAELNTGKTAWTNVQMMRGEFARVGAAGSATNGWNNVVAWQVSIRTQPNAAVNIAIDDFLFIAGSELDAFNGNPYDYRVTLYNQDTGDESNPSITLAPSQFISPRRQPALISLNQLASTINPASSGVNSGSGTLWTNPALIGSPVSYADVNVAANASSQLLLAENFGFAFGVNAGIPASVTVTSQYYWTGAPGLVIPTILVQMLKAGVPVGPAQQVFLGAFNAGSSGSPLTLKATFPVAGFILSDFNDPGFGFAISVRGGSAGAHVFARFGEITVGLAPLTQPDTQVTHWRLYRRGGTLTQAWYRVDTIPIATHFYLDTISDATIELNDQLKVDQDPPVTSVMAVPLNAILDGIAQPQGPGLATLTLNAVAGNIFIGQRLTIGTGDNQEQAYVQTVAGTAVGLWLQNTHALGETVSATTRPQRAMNLMAIAFDKAWLAGDPDNPHVLYYSVTFSPEVFPPQNFIEIGTPDAPIVAIIAHRGLLYVGTTKTIYQILGAGSAVPIAVQTGVKHGFTGSFAWATSEGIIWYESYDGIYAFSGGQSAYTTQPVEWIFTAKNLGPVQAEDVTQKSLTVMAYANHEVFVSYVGLDGLRHRMIYSDTYSRWRNDDSAQTQIEAEYFEEDTGTLLVGGLDGMIYQDRANDYDWGALASSVLVKTPIPIALQTAQMDQGVSKAFKVYNEFTLDANLNGQTVSLSLLFDDGNTSLSIGTLTGTGRQQYQVNINAGIGQRSQNIGLLITGNVTARVVLHECHIRYLAEAEFRRSFDSYWQKYGTDEFKTIKQGWFEYSAPSGLSFAMYGEGNSTAPLFTFTLPPSPIRKTERVRFPATKGTTFRLVATSVGDFQFYAPDSMIEWKPISSSKGYARQKLSP